MAKADVRKFRNFTKIFNVQIVSCVLEDNIYFVDNHLNRWLMFLNCFFLDLTVINLISIVHMDKIWFEIANRF